MNSFFCEDMSSRPPPSPPLRTTPTTTTTNATEGYYHLKGGTDYLKPYSPRTVGSYQAANITNFFI